MALVIGLGNPGRRYQRTRHNVGFRVVEAVAERLGVVFAPVPGSVYVEAVAAGARGRLHLVKPLTYMNLSGEALRAWRRDRLASGPDSTATCPLLVVCDDLALPLGSLRLRARGSAGGQKGLRSILVAAGTTEVSRLRLGVAGAADPLPREWADYVLEEFQEAEEPAVLEMVGRAVAAVFCWLEEGTEAAASRHNRRERRSAVEVSPAEPSPPERSARDAPGTDLA